jgi:hypothetical protein
VVQTVGTHPPWHALPEHVAPPRQALPHLPQLSMLEVVSRHVPPHIMYPGAPQTHEPPEQVMPVPHDVQLDPQWVASVFVSNAHAVVTPHAL